MQMDPVASEWMSHRCQWASVVVCLSSRFLNGKLVGGNAVVGILSTSLDGFLGGVLVDLDGQLS